MVKALMCFSYEKKKLWLCGPDYKKRWIIQHFIHNWSTTIRKMKIINSILLTIASLTINQVVALNFDFNVKRGGAEPIKPFMTDLSLDDFRNKKLMLARRLAIKQKIRNPKLRNVIALLLQKKQQKLEKCNRNYNCYKTAKDSNRLNRFKKFHHWF